MTTTTLALHPRDQEFLASVEITVSYDACEEAIADLAFENTTRSLGERQLVSLASCPSPAAWESAVRAVGVGQLFVSSQVNVRGVNVNLCGSAHGWGLLPGCPDEDPDGPDHSTFDGLAWVN